MTAGSHRKGGTHASGLVARGVSVRFEGLQALDSVDLHVDRGHILGLIGPNGAGKTTLVNVLSGFQESEAGTVTLEGQDLTGRSPHHIARAGLVRTFQGMRVFGELTASENIQLGALARNRMNQRQARGVAQELLESLGLSGKADRRASTLPLGDERRIGFLRALAAQPAYLLLDEPAAGLNDVESSELAGLIDEARRRWNIGIVLIEHDMQVVMQVCDTVQVLDHGRTLTVGSPDEVRANADVIVAYLGGQ
ncbi:MAG: ABC transporter ATP-binding protein [bacterium]|nr:ABC transporter ATP-binding protein [bacterium]